MFDYPEYYFVPVKYCFSIRNFDCYEHKSVFSTTNNIVESEIYLNMPSRCFECCVGSSTIACSL